MGFKKIAEYKNVREFYVGDQLFFIDYFSKLHDQNSKMIKSFNGGSYGMIECGNKLYHSNPEEKIYEIQDGEFFEKEFSGFNFLGLNDGSYLVFSAKDGRQTKKVSNGEIIWQKPSVGFNVQVEENYYIYKPQYKTSQIEIRELDTFEVILNFEYGKGFLVKHPYYIKGNTLIIQYMNNERPMKKLFLGVDIPSGKLLWEANPEALYMLNDKQSNFLYKVISRRDSEELFLLNLDCSSGHFKASPIGTWIKNSMIPAFHSIIENDIIFFPETEDGGMIGAVNVRSEKLLDTFKFHFEETRQFYPLKSFDNNVFVKDDDEVLHHLIFEM